MWDKNIKKRTGNGGFIVEGVLSCGWCLQLFHVSIQIHQFRVGMTCGGCEKAVRAVLSHVPGISNVTIDLSTKLVTMTGTATAEQCKAALSKTGKSVELVVA